MINYSHCWKISFCVVKIALKQPFLLYSASVLCSLCEVTGAHHRGLRALCLYKPQKGEMMNLGVCLVFMLSFTQPPLLIFLFECESLMLLLNLGTSFSLTVRGTQETRHSAFYVLDFFLTVFVFFCLCLFRSLTIRLHHVSGVCRGDNMTFVWSKRSCGHGSDIIGRDGLCKWFADESYVWRNLSLNRRKNKMQTCTFLDSIP